MTDILIPKKNIVMDSQVLSTLMACPRLTDFRFNHNFQAVSGKSVSLEMGSIVHKFLEVYYRSIINGLNRSSSEAHAHVAAVAYAASDEVRNSTDEDRQWALTTCHEYCEYYKNDFWVPLEVETVKGKVLYEDDEIRILWKAKMDWIADTNQGIFPIDHKTMKQRRDTLTLNNQFIGQSLLMQTRMMFENKIGFQKTLKPAERFTRVIVSFTTERMIEWQSVILPYYAKLMLMYSESEYWPPNWTHCQNKYGNCKFASVCEANPSMREETLGAEFIVGKPWDISTNEDD